MLNDEVENHVSNRLIRFVGIILPLPIYIATDRLQMVESRSGTVFLTLLPLAYFP